MQFTYQKPFSCCRIRVFFAALCVKAPGSKAGNAKDAEAARWKAARFAKERKGKLLILDLGFLCGPLRERPERAPFAPSALNLLAQKQGTQRTQRRLSGRPPVSRRNRKGKLLILDLGFLCGPLRERPERAPLAALCVKSVGFWIFMQKGRRCLPI